MKQTRVKEIFDNLFYSTVKIWVLRAKRWCILRPTHICYTSLLTFAKSAIKTSDLQACGLTAVNWTYSCSLLTPSWPSQGTKHPYSSLATALGKLVGQKFSRGDIPYRRCNFTKQKTFECSFWLTHFVRIQEAKITNRSQS